MIIDYQMVEAQYAPEFNIHVKKLLLSGPWEPYGLPFASKSYIVQAFIIKTDDPITSEESK